MPEEQPVAGKTLSLNGMGLRKATIFAVKVYVAGLYLSEKSESATAILAKDQPWHLDLRFLRDVDAADIRDAWEEGFESNAESELAALKDRIAVLQQHMTDLVEGGQSCLQLPAR